MGWPYPTGGSPEDVWFFYIILIFFIPVIIFIILLGKDISMKGVLFLMVIGAILTATLLFKFCCEISNRESSPKHSKSYNRKVAFGCLAVAVYFIIIGLYSSIFYLFALFMVILAVVRLKRK